MRSAELNLLADQPDQADITPDGDDVASAGSTALACAKIEVGLEAIEPAEVEAAGAGLPDDSARVLSDDESPVVPTATQRAVRRHQVRGPALRRSLTLVTVAWLFGSVWFTSASGAPFTLFASALRATKFQFGLLAALPYIASLACMPGSLLAERTGQRKRIFLFTLYLQRALWIPMALIPYLLVRHYGIMEHGPAMVIFIGLCLMMYTTGAVGGTAWTSWMADIVPQRSRGKYFSVRRQLGILTAIPAAWLAGWLLDRNTTGASPLVTLRWCTIVFIASAIFGIIDIHLFHYVPAIPRVPQRGGELLRNFLEPLRHKQFLYFGAFVATLVFAVSFMGQFLTLYLIEQCHITSSGVQLMLLVAPMLAQLAVLPIWGKAVDRMGKKPVLALSALGLVPVGLGWCLMSGGNLWLGYALSALGAALWTGVEVANLNLVLEMSQSREATATSRASSGGTSYVAVNSVIVNLAGCAGGLAAGVIAQSLSHWTYNIAGFKTISFYDVLFALSALLRGAAVILFLPHLIEPTARPTRETLLFMSANIYNNLFNAVLYPLRLLRIREKETYREA